MFGSKQFYVEEKTKIFFSADCTNIFKNYMGSGYSTQKWSDFVSNVRDGDFIGVDFGDDGSVDHMGFVYTKIGGKLKLAQHTKNYLDRNGGWPDYDGEGRYYRVRR